MEYNIDEFMEHVDAKFAGQTPPNGSNDDDPGRLTVGFNPPWARLVTHIGL